MRRALSHTPAVLLVTAATALAVYVAVTAGIILSPAQTNGVSADTVRACPQTGCTSADCHGETGQPPPSAGGGQYGGSDSQGPGGGMLTCPRTGCASVDCHGANGQPPPRGRGGRGGWGRHDEHQDPQGRTGSDPPVYY